MTTITIHVEEHVRERGLAQLQETEGVHVGGIRRHSEETPDQRFEREYPYSKEALVEDVTEALVFAQEVKAGRKRSRPIR